jgi:hypothetical protein
MNPTLPCHSSSRSTSVAVSEVKRLRPTIRRCGKSTRDRFRTAMTAIKPQTASLNCLDSSINSCSLIAVDTRQLVNEGSATSTRVLWSPHRVHRPIYRLK